MFDAVHRRYGHEELFADRYDALVRAALKITEGDRQAAEDLVQDAFIRFTLVQPCLDDIERVDAYLFGMLRNMYTSRVRRRGRLADVSLSILDFDSVDVGLRSLDAAERLAVRQTLFSACRYGCIRKRSSKVGSVFLLRFFHSYLPSEIARLTRLSPAIVDALVFRARREVKLFVEHPEQLAFIDGRETVIPSSASLAPLDDLSEDAMVRSLRSMIFDDRHERCWSRRQLRDLYADGRRDPLSKEDLSALVSCPTCLDEANNILNVAKLEHRWPTDTSGPGSRGSAGSRRSAERLSNGRRRAQAVFEHRPRQLRVLVNGFELGSHTVGSQQSELVLVANVSEPVALVELFSEQGLCLLFLDACPPPDGSVRQRRHVELSDGRHADLELTFGGPWPTVRATYVDPRGDAPLEIDDVEADSAPTTVASHPATSSWVLGLFGWRPAPARILLGALLIWLLFWTPGVQVSAAERIVNTIKWLVAQLLDESPAPSPTPVSSAPVVPSPATPPSAASVNAARVVEPARPAALAAARRTALELRVIAQLQRVEAYLGQEVSFGATHESHVELRAAVDGDERKRTLIAGLGPLMRDPQVRVDIEDLRVTAEGVRQQVIETVPPTHDFAFERDHFSMFETLRGYFQHQREFQSRPNVTLDSSSDGSADARRFAMNVLDHSRRASQHAWALKHLSDRFSARAIRSAASDTQDLWQDVIREHARAYQLEIALLRTALEPVIQASGLVEVPRSDAEIAAPDGAFDVWSAVSRLLTVHETQNGAIQAAFAIQAGQSSGGNVVQTTAFWRLLDECESLVARIASVPFTR